MIDRIDRKREVLVHVAKYCFEGTLEAHKEFIPLEIVPHGSQPTHRCCVYREREVLRNRVDWACGRASVYDGENHYTFTDQPVAVMNSACEGCPLQRYTVTSNCQHCMAQRCLQACRFGAITMTHQGAIINPDKCRECGMCAQACPYNAIADARRPCVRSCPVDAISVDKKNRRASIDYNKCISCGNCTVACPFSAISDVSMITDVIEAIRDEKQEVYACFAPSIEGQFGGVNVGEMIKALQRLGFADAMEVSLGADATAYYEAQEARVDDPRRVALLHAAVHLDEDIAPRPLDHLPNFRNLRHAVLAQRLPAEPRLHRHHQHEVAQRQQRLKRADRRFRVDAHARANAQRVDGLQRFGAVVLRLDMHGNQIRARLGICLDVLHRPGQHQVRIQKQIRLPANRAHKVRPEADVRRKVPVHVVQMQPVNPQRFRHFDFFAQTHQIRAQHGRRNFNDSFAHS